MVLNIAVYIDYESPIYQNSLDLNLLLSSIEQDYGSISIQKAYADWAHFIKHKEKLIHANFTLVEVTQYNTRGKNAVDIKMAIDAIDTACDQSKSFIDTFVIIAGDSDYSPLISMLKSYGKKVIFISLSNTNPLIKKLAYQFINIDKFKIAELTKSPNHPKKEETLTNTTSSLNKAFKTLYTALNELNGSSKKVIGTAVSDTMRNIDKNFTLKGLRIKFNTFLEHAQKKGIIDLHGKKDGSYVITLKQDIGTNSCSNIKKGFSTLCEAVRNMQEQNKTKDFILSVVIRNEIKRIDKSFDFKSLGFKKFGDFLRKAENQEMIILKAGKDDLLVNLPETQKSTKPTQKPLQTPLSQDLFAQSDLSTHNPVLKTIHQTLLQKIILTGNPIERVNNKVKKIRFFAE